MEGTNSEESSNTESSGKGNTLHQRGGGDKRETDEPRLGGKRVWVGPSEQGAEIGGGT